MNQTFTVEIYDRLIAAVAALPKEAIEKTQKEKTRKGYDTTGYQYQFLVNVLNEVIGPEGWNFEYEIIKEIIGQFKSGQAYYDLTVKMTITILGNSKSCVGGHQASSYADALKGAITNSFKKTLAFFGPGKMAYEGTLDDDYLPYPSPTPQKTITIQQAASLRESWNQAIEATCQTDEDKETKTKEMLNGFGCQKWGQLTTLQAEDIRQRINDLTK
jgi:hypothetical protein